MFWLYILLQMMQERLQFYKRNILLTCIRCQRQGQQEIELHFQNAVLLKTLSQFNRCFVNGKKTEYSIYVPLFLRHHGKPHYSSSCLFQISSWRLINIYSTLLSFTFISKNCLLRSNRDRREDIRKTFRGILLRTLLQQNTFPENLICSVFIRSSN